MVSLTVALLRGDMARDIRRAEPSDVPAIRSVAADAWHEAHAPIIGTDTVAEFLAEYYDPASFQDRIDHTATILAVATDTENTVVGYILATPIDTDGTTFALSQIYVVPDRWAEGIGQRLLDHVEQKSRDCGGERISLGVMAENDRAIGFYEAAGYNQTDEFYDDRIDAHSYTYEKALE